MRRRDSSPPHSFAHSMLIFHPIDLHPPPILIFLPSSSSFILIFQDVPLYFLSIPSKRKEEKERKWERKRSVEQIFHLFFCNKTFRVWVTKRKRSLMIDLSIPRHPLPLLLPLFSHISFIFQEEERKMKEWKIERREEERERREEEKERREEEKEDSLHELLYKHENIRFNDH